MRLLVSGATATVKKYADSPYLGHLDTPDTGNSVRTICAAGLPIALDNSCFLHYRPGHIVRLWGAYHGVDVLWAALPDVVADAAATMALYASWRPVLAALNIPAALVAQDGLERMAVPWDGIRCLFIGGSTEWKEGPHAFGLAREAKRRGKWVHVGRVNSQDREAVCWKMGADSFDGTQYSMFPGTHIPRCLARMAETTQLMEDLLCAA